MCGDDVECTEFVGSKWGDGGVFEKRVYCVLCAIVRDAVSRCVGLCSLSYG